jgi:hypothetical protein
MERRATTTGTGSERGEVRTSLPAEGEGVRPAEMGTWGPMRELPDYAYRNIAWGLSALSLLIAAIGLMAGIVRSGCVAISWVPFIACLVVVAAPGVWIAWQLVVRGERGFERVRAAGTKRYGRLAQGLCVGLGFLALTHLISGGSFVGHVIKQGPMAAMIVGFALIGASLVSVGGVTRCAKCEYPRPKEARTAEILEDRCPECGAYWRQEGGWVVGKKTRNVPMLVAGVILAMMPFVHAGLSLSRVGPRMAGMALRVVPTDGLIAEVTRLRPGFTSDEWAELSKRTLSASQRERLITGLIAQRKDSGYLDRAAEAFLEKAALAGEMKAEVRERFFAEMIDTKLKRMQVSDGTRKDGGTQIRVGIEAEFRGNLSFPTNTTLRTRVLFAGYYVGDDATPHAREMKEIDGLAFGTWRVRLREREAGDLPTFVLPAGATERDVKAVVWVVVARWDVAMIPIKWNEKGEPELPAGVVWVERRELGVE